MLPPYAAHTPPDDGGEWQSLNDHLRQTAERARQFGAPLGITALATAAGMLHDVGKCSAAFQRYLQECDAATHAGLSPRRHHVDHKALGAEAALAADQLLAFVIAGHHGGLRSPAGVKNLLAQAQASPEIVETRARMRDVMSHYNLPTMHDLATEAETQASNAWEAEVLLRMLFACLVDADALDTERHFSPERAEQRAVTLTLMAMRDHLETEQLRLMAGVADTAVNRVRRVVYEDCLHAAELPPGVFKLTVPTGGGKTRSSLAFALRHAVNNDLQRVIYAIPYTSIIEQTADVFRGIFPDPYAVLEHHASVQEAEDDDHDGARGDARLWQRLAAENWDAPLIVTTTVQLFESLFASRPGKCRKVHRIARSVLVLDEVQTLPEHLLAPILDLLSTLVRRYGTTVVLCTATQPALAGETQYLRGLPDTREIITDPRQHFTALQRVEYRIIPEPWTWQQAADAMRAYDQVLVVLNRKNDAMAMLQALGDADALHLSTRLCGAHRRVVLAAVHRRLREGLPCRLIATQVVEAGVDLDFPVVMRAAGPLDRVVQAAGRCNREGRREHGEVIIFTPVEGGTPCGAYKTACAHAGILLRDPTLDLHDPNTFTHYFAGLYADINTDARGVQEDRRMLRFDTVAEKFRVIDSDTVPVLAPYDRCEVERIAEQARQTGHVSRELWQRAQPHCVSLYRYEFTRHRQEGLVIEVLPDSGLYRWLGGYDSVCGLTETTDPADLVI